MRIASSLPIASLALLALAFGPATSPVRASVPTGDPVFTAPLDFDNTYFPFVLYRIRVYEQTAGTGELTVLDVFRPDTRTFTWNGDHVACRVLEEWEVDAGEIVEISRNFFAQADDGTVYYFGETVDTYEGGVVTGHGGSWLVGGPGPGDPEGTLTAIDPTVFMPAAPEVGDTWKAEDLPDQGVEEFDEVERFVNRLRVPAGTFEDVLLVEERTPGVGHKWYAPGVGFIQQKDPGEVVSLEEIVDSDDEDEMEEALEEIVEDLMSGD
jgi:hypothetical protein